MLNHSRLKDQICGILALGHETISWRRGRRKIANVYGIARMLDAVGTVVDRDRCVIWNDIVGLAKGWRQFLSLLGQDNSDGSRE